MNTIDSRFIGQKIKRFVYFQTARPLQIFLVFASSWFIFWAHVYEIAVWNKTFLESVQASTFNVVAYSLSILAAVFLELHIRRINENRHANSPSANSQEELRKENELLKRELMKSKQVPSNRIGIGFLISGALILSISIVTSSSALAFIGLGLVFWGALFLVTRPVKFVRSALLDFTATASYITIDRIIDDLGFKGKSIYVPPYPRKAYLPEYLKGLKETIVYITAEDVTAIPTIEEMAKKRFLLENPKGICIAPPGYGLINLFEKELKMEFTQIDLDQLCSNLPAIVVNNLELAKEFQIGPENKFIHLKLVDSVYKDLYSSENNFKSIHLIGCPLTSAVACALSKTTGKLITVVKDVVSPDLRTIEVWYQPLEAK